MFNNKQVNNILEGLRQPQWSHPMNTISGEALQLLEDFIKYAELYSEEMADLMYYDYDAFNKRLKLLKKQLGE